METLIVHAPDGDKAKAVKAVLKALSVSYEKSKKKHTAKKDKPYNPEFVAKILERQKEYEDGKFKAIKTEELWK